MVAAATCSVVGVWLVLRGMSFFGDAFVHGEIAAGDVIVVAGVQKLDPTMEVRLAFSAPASRETAK